MKLLMIGVGLLFMVAVCWPLVLLILVLCPLAWLLAIPLAMVGIHMSAPVACMALLAALVYFPARMLGYRV